MEPTRRATWFSRHRGVPLFSVLGIRIVADYSWFLIVALIAGTLTLGWFPTELPGRGTLQYVILGIITAFFFFASVLVHELSHSVVAVLSGIPVRRITLFLFGGVAEITKEPADPRTELKVALAGPATSAVLAAIFWSIVVLMGDSTGRPGLQLAFFYLAFANTALLVFNLLPGLPLDGGRVLRAVVWAVTKNIRRATYVASMSGKAIAGLLVILGLFAILSGGNVIAGLWFIFIALFLRRAADTSYRQILLKEALGGVRIMDVMTPDVVTVPPTISLAELVDVYFLRHHFICYPVVDGTRPVGVISIRDVKHVPRDRWSETSVSDAMSSFSPDTTLRPDEGIPAAMQKMAASGLGRLAVLDGDRLLGIVTRRDIMSHIQIRTDLSG